MSMFLHILPGLVPPEAGLQTGGGVVQHGRVQLMYI